MKNIFSLIIAGLLTITAATAQTKTTKSETQNPVFAIEAFTESIHQSGQPNYLVSLDEQNLKNRKYFFYTDENATIAYLSINGKIIKMSGGENAEHILAYSGMGYTVTLNINKATAGKMDDGKTLFNAAMAIYYSNGQVMGKQVKVVEANTLK